MSDRFKGKFAVVTGGNSGIGLGVAKAYAREGAKVAITGRNERTLQTAAAEIGPGTLAIQADVSRVADIDRAMSQIGKAFGRIDALFVNAGVGEFKPFDQVTEALYDQTMAINVKGLFFTVQKALPFLANGSAVVLNASINARLAMPNSTVYGASKAAAVHLARLIAADPVGRGIRVNSVSPGPIKSAILDRSGLPAQEVQQTKDWIVSQVPMKRFGEPDDIAAAVLYLTSPESSYVIGSDLIVDGGMATLK